MTTREPVLAVRTIPSGRNYNLTFRVEGGLHYLRGNSKPYFTLTYTSHRKGFPNQCYSGGAGHEEILKYYPRFADIAALHLSDIDGVPMHAEANGWYQLAGALPDHAGQKYHAGNSEQHFPKVTIDPAKPWATTDYRKPTPEECLQMFADHVRIPVYEAQTVVDGVLAAGEGRDWKAGRAWFVQWIEEQKPRWAREAQACIEKHDLRVFGDAWPEVAA